MCQSTSTEIKMCEASSRNDTDLWGEINVNTYVDCNENLWKPIHEYQNIKQNISFIYQSCYSNAFTPKSKKQKLSYDPVGQRIIQLRKSYYELELLCEAIMEEKNVNECTSSKLNYKETELSSFATPKFPGKYSENLLTDLCEDSFKKVTSRRSLTESEVKEHILYFIKQVLFENGYYAEDCQNCISPTKFLSIITEKFLIGFINLLKFHKNSAVFSESDDLWGPLETTLQEIEYHGINGLYKFSSRRLPKYNRLLKECDKMLARYKKLKT